MDNYDLLEFRKYMRKSEVEKAVNTLEGILRGILLDNKLNLAENEEYSKGYYMVYFQIMS